MICELNRSMRSLLARFAGLARLTELAGLAGQAGWAGWAGCWLDLQGWLVFLLLAAGCWLLVERRDEEWKDF